MDQLDCFNKLRTWNVFFLQGQKSVDFFFLQFLERCKKLDVGESYINTLMN